MANYTVTNPVSSGNSQQVTLTDIDNASKIDVLKLLGRPAKKILVQLANGDAVDLTINAALRKTVPFVSGTTDINGVTSTLPRTGYWDSTATPPQRVPGADNRSDVAVNIWGQSGLDLTLSNGSGNPMVYNSYTDYGDLIINNIDFTSVVPNSGSTITVTFVA